MTVISRYDVTFVGMVLPGDELKVDIHHTGMCDGSTVVKVETWNARGENVLQGSAEVSQPPTVYVFTGQGPQEAGMGMDLYNSSPAACAVWEGADAHLAVYGFSIVEIVKDNPKAKTIHFGGIKGQDIRQRYMNMAYDAMDKDGNIKTLFLTDRICLFRQDGHAHSKRHGISKMLYQWHRLRGGHHGGAAWCSYPGGSS